MEIQSNPPSRLQPLPGNPLPALPVAIIGAGPVGLAAAAHVVQRGLQPMILERGAAPASAMQAWGHVRVFSPWRFNVDAAAAELLAQTGWRSPDPEGLPTGAELVRDYLAPLAAHPAIAPHLRCNARVFSVTREGFDRITSAGRASAPFIVQWRDAAGHEQSIRAQAVIDASGTWHQPNPMGVDGSAVTGEWEATTRIAYGIPHVLGISRNRYAGRRVLVVGAGHSATNVALDLMKLQQQVPATTVMWALRHNRVDKLVGGGASDKLSARGALGLAAQAAIRSGKLTLLAGFAARQLTVAEDGVRVTGTLGGQADERTVDEIIVATGFRPEHGLSRELRVALDSVLEAPPALAPLIDPNLHSCGTVPPHGVVELSHPEPGFYIAGAKSYGRAPTFLMATGYEQVRSIVAEIAGDHESARRVQLVLPETGVCNTSARPAAETEGCCGGAAPQGVEACCAQDAAAKAAGAEGCGCGTEAETPQATQPKVRASSCCGSRK